MSATLIDVTGVFRNPDNSPAQGSIVFETVWPWPNEQDPRIVVQGPVTAVLDQQGQMRVQLVASDDPDWRSDRVVPYRVIRRLQGHRVQIDLYTFHGPGPVDLVTLTPINECDYPWVSMVPVPGPAGATGPAGPKGDKGDPGAGIDYADIMGMTPVPYDAGHAYAEGDIIQFNGSLWVAKGPTSAGQDPASNPGKWLVIDLEAVALKAAHAQNAAAELAGQIVVDRPNTDDVRVQVRDSAGVLQTVHYDSGWRDVSSLLVNGYTLNSGYKMLLRRVGQDITLMFTGVNPLNASAKTNATFFVPPAGFTSNVQSSSNTVIGHLFTYAAPAVARYVQANQSLGLQQTSTDSNLGGTIRYVTTDAIPTSLPGTLVSPAPA